MQDFHRTVIVGAGLAGASVAWHLQCARERSAHAPAGRAEVLVLERETQCATHASAQNAAMIRSLSSEVGVAEAAIEGALFWNGIQDALQLPQAFRRTGSLLLFEEAETKAFMEERIAEARNSGLHPELWSRERTIESYPFLASTPFVHAAWSPEDGVADPSALVDAFLAKARQGGAELRLASPVRHVLTRSGRALGVELEDGTKVEAEQVVLASGAWVPEQMLRVGARDHGLRPRRRHIFCTRTRGPVPQDAPFVWHLDRGCYLRPEGTGLLFSICDEDVMEACRPAVDERVLEHGDARLAACFPFLRSLELGRRWAGLRTYRPGAAFVIGEDPEIEGLHYAAGLGGHGVTCAAPVGRLAAAALRPEESPVKLEA